MVDTTSMQGISDQDLRGRYAAPKDNRQGIIGQPTMRQTENLLYIGDNAEGLRQLATMQIKVGLVYIDPPYGTGNEFLIDESRANSISASGSFAYPDKTKGDAYLESLSSRLIATRQIMAYHASIYVHIDTKMEHRVRLVMDNVFGEKNFRNSITRIKCNPKNFRRFSYGNIKDTILFSLNPRHGLLGILS